MWHQHSPGRKAFSDSLCLKIHHLCVEPRAGQILYDYGGSSIVRTMPKTILSLLQCLLPFFILLPCTVLWLLVGLGPSLVTLTPKNLPAVQETWFNPWIGKISWRRERLPTPVFLPGEFHGRRSLSGCSPWSCKESDRTEQLKPTLHFH